MNCPVDGSELRMSERQGVEIDYCPQCRGVWLDRGELDKIIDRDSAAFNSAYEGEGGYRQERDKYHGGRRKRKSFLEEIFD